MVAGHYAIGNYIRESNVQKFRPMTADIYWEQCVFMTRKSSILLPMLDMLILRIAESGLPAFWENEVLALYHVGPHQVFCTILMLPGVHVVFGCKSTRSC